MLKLLNGSGRPARVLLGRGAPLDCEAMRHVIAHERARVDRYRGQLSLVSVAPHGDGEHLSRDLSQSITARTRETDCVGWLDGRRLCVLLPETEGPGARVVGRAIGRMADELGEAVKVEIDTYDGKDGDDSGRLERRCEFSVSTTVRECPPILGVVAKRTPLLKRAMDIVGAVVGLAVAAPVVLMAAAAIKLTSPGPAVFSQWRSGLGGRPFRMYKLRTMVVDAERRKAGLRKHSEQDGPAFKMSHDPRVTPIGRLLRRTSIDELPQLWNVLKGEMSLVGPRPLPCDEMAACEPWQRRRLDVAPGLTCIWQVKGRSRVSFTDWARMDAAYVQNRTLLGDLVLILQTIPAVVLGRGAH